MSVCLLNSSQSVILSDRNRFSPTRVFAKDLALKFEGRSFAENVTGEMTFQALRMTVGRRSEAFPHLHCTSTID